MKLGVERLTSVAIARLFMLTGYIKKIRCFVYTKYGLKSYICDV